MVRFVTSFLLSHYYYAHIICPLKRMVQMFCCKQILHPKFCIFASRASRYRGGGLLVGGIAPNPPEPRFTRSHTSTKLTLQAFAINAKKRETPLHHHSEISHILIMSVQLFSAFQQPFPDPQF